MSAIGSKLWIFYLQPIIWLLHFFITHTLWDIFFLFIGEIRECFPTTFKLGRRNRPIKVTNECQLQRTQNDPNSSIRACICTSDYCNDDLSANKNQVGGNNNLLHSFHTIHKVTKFFRMDQSLAFNPHENILVFIQITSSKYYKTVQNLNHI